MLVGHKCIESNELIDRALSLTWELHDMGFDVIPRTTGPVPDYIDWCWDGGVVVVAVVVGFLVDNIFMRIYSVIRRTGATIHYAPWP